MRSKILQEVLDSTPKDVEIFVRLYAKLLIRISEVLKEKGLTQKALAENLDKNPSEIHKWLSGEHNFTLRSLAKLEAELGETLLEVPVRKSVGAFQKVNNKKMIISYRNPPARDENARGLWAATKMRKVNKAYEKASG